MDWALATVGAAKRINKTKARLSEISEVDTTCLIMIHIPPYTPWHDAA
jgi:hypothetical protein